jgi:dynein heavy chain
MAQDDIVLQKIHEILPNVPEYFNFETVLTKVNNRGQMPHDICGKQEIERMQAVVKTLRVALADLELAVNGTIVMNDPSYNSMNSLYDGYIPLHWLRTSCPTKMTKD